MHLTLNGNSESTLVSYVVEMLWRPNKGAYAPQCRIYTSNFEAGGGGLAGELLELEIRVEKQLASNTENRLAGLVVMFSKNSLRPFGGQAA